MRITQKIIYNLFFILMLLAINELKANQSVDGKQFSKFEVIQEIPDIEIGSPDAPVKLVEYSALNCAHCARFHLIAWPKLKQKYIDTGKVKFIYRYFPIDVTSIYAMAVVATLPQDKWFEAITKAYKCQRDWMGKDFSVLAQICEIPAKDYQKNLHDDKLRDSIIAKRFNAEQRITIEATPTFHIITATDSEVINYPISDADLEKKIEAKF